MSTVKRQVLRRCQVCGAIFYTSSTNRITCSEKCREYYKKNRKTAKSLGHVIPFWVQLYKKKLIANWKIQRLKKEKTKRNAKFWDTIIQDDIKRLREGGRIHLKRCKKCTKPINPPYKLCFDCWRQSICWRLKTKNELEKPIKVRRRRKQN